MLRPVRFKPLLAGTAIIALAGSSLVYAQQGFGAHGNVGDGRDGGPRFEQRHRLSIADITAFTDARIAALKAGLELTPDQAKNWPPFEQALRDMAQLRIQNIQARLSGEQQTSTTPFDRLERRADNMAKRSAALKKVADAGAPLYQSLNDDQKQRFKMLARIYGRIPACTPSWSGAGATACDLARVMGAVAKDSVTSARSTTAATLNRVRAKAHSYNYCAIAGAR